MPRLSQARPIRLAAPGRAALLMLPVLSMAFAPRLGAQEAAIPATRSTAAYRAMKDYLDKVPAIDTHDHLRPFAEMPGKDMTDKGPAMTLHSLFASSYYPQVGRLTGWRAGESFVQWWARAKHDFDDSRATTFYRYQLPALADLYGVDFDRITDEQAADLNKRIVANYHDSRWLRQVVTEKANIELMLVDPYWARLEFLPHYPFSAVVFNVTTLVRGFHEGEYSSPLDSPYALAKSARLPMNSLDDYLVVLDRLFDQAKKGGAVCLKSTLAYERTLDFAKVPKEEAAALFGKTRRELGPEKAKKFEDFIFWTLCELSARYDLPFQIHTGHGRVQGSNPILLVDLIEKNPRTKFILFHGGFPWIGETGIILMRHWRHVWLDSVWVPTLSYTMAKRAFHEWLEVMPATQILWGADCTHAEGIYGATEMTRRCVAEVLAEKIAAGDLNEHDARRIGRAILRDNALALFPSLKSRLWKKEFE